MGFFNDVKKWFSDRWDGFGDVVNTVYSDIKGGVSAVYHSFDDTRNTIIHGIADNTKSLIKSGENVITKGEDVVKDLGKDATVAVSNIGGDVRDLGSNLGKNIEGVTSNLSLPLLIGGGAALLFLIKK